MSLNDLASELWHLRELLELLLFKLEEEQVLLAAGRTRWVPHATREVELVLEQIRQAEQRRARYTQVVAAALGLPQDVSMVNLANRAPAPWGELLHQHRRAFLTLTAEITAVAGTNRDLATGGQRAARETMLRVTRAVETYGADGGRGTTGPAGTYGPTGAYGAYRSPGGRREADRRAAGDGRARLVDEAL